MSGGGLRGCSGRRLLASGERGRKRVAARPSRLVPVLGEEWKAWAAAAVERGRKGVLRLSFLPSHLRPRMGGLT